MIPDTLERTDKYLRGLLMEKQFPEAHLRMIALEVYTNVSLKSLVQAFVLPTEKCGLEKGFFIFAVYAKTPGHRRLVVSKEIYKTKEECAREAIIALKYFPLYGLSSRFLMDFPWQMKK